MDFQSGFGVNMPNVFQQFLNHLKGEDPALPSKESDDFRSMVASASFKIGRDYLQFPKVVVLPVTARGVGVPGMSERPWSRLYADLFFAGNSPIMYSISIHREPPDTMQSNLRARRTMTEGLIMAMAEKTGRRPSMAEKITDTAMDAAESSLALGRPIYKVSLLAALYADLTRYDEVETIRRSIEAKMRTMGLIPQRLDAIPERALYYLQPGGKIFPDLDEPILFAEEIAALLPKPSRQIMPADDSVWIGRHLREGRDVYFSFTRGMDPTAPAPPHAISLVLGEMGSGKTTLMRWIFLQRLLQGRTILSIDPEGENNKLCEKVGGHVIPAGVPEDKETCLIHPLVADTPEEMLLAVRFLVAALTEVSTLTPGVQAALHEAVKRRWERRPGEQMSITDLVEVLATISTPDALVPMSLLRPYMRGGLFEGFFDRPRALLSTDFPAGEWWNFDLSTLREENKGIVHGVLAWFMYYVVTVGKKPLDICIDEGWRLLRSGPFTDLLDELGRRARKRGTGVMLLTHLPQDLAKASTSLNMASVAFVGRLSRDEAFGFFRHMGTPEAEAAQRAEEASRLPPRVFMVVPSGGRGALYEVQVTIPPMWLKYWDAIGASTDGTAKLKA
jgi:AAA-like domain